MNRILLSLLLLGFAVPAAAEEPSGSLLLDQVLETYGGTERLRAWDAVRQDGTITSTMRGSGSLSRTLVLPDRLRSETRYDGKAGELRILDGERGWRNGRPASGMPHMAMVLQAARLALPRLLLEGRDRVIDIGSVDRDGRTLRVLDLPLRPGTELILEIDPASHHVVRTLGRMDKVEFTVDYSDFRRVDGLLFPFREVTFANGFETSRIEIESVDLDSEISTDLFAP